MIFLINFKIYFIFFKNFKNKNLNNKDNVKLVQNDKFYFFFIKFNLILYKIFYFFLTVVLIFIIKYSLTTTSSFIYINGNVGNFNFIFTNKIKITNSVIIKITTLLKKNI